MSVKLNAVQCITLHVPSSSFTVYGVFSDLLYVYKHL